MRVYEQDSRAAAVSELHQAKEQASAVNRRRKAINILAEARKDAHQQAWLSFLNRLGHHSE